MAGLWEHFQCALATYYMWRCGRIVNSPRIKTREGRQDFGRFSHRSMRWSPPGCPVWVNGRAKYSIEAVGETVSRETLVERGHISSP